MSESPAAILYDSAGNPIEVVGFGGKYYVANSIIQNVKESTGNSSTANLAAGASFTGASDSTFGVVGLQVNIKTDQPVRVFVEQSMDGNNWDISDDYDLPPNIGLGRTTQATAAYIRVRVLNIGPTITSYFRLQTVLCPMVEALPRTLTPEGNLRLSRRTDSFVPDPSNFSQPVTEGPSLRLDYEDNLNIRGPVLTDELSFRTDFTDGEIYTDLTGTCVFTNGLQHVIGSGTSFLSEVRVGRYLKLSTDDDSYYLQVTDVLSDTDLKLGEAYTGTGGSGTGRSSNWLYEIGSGTAITETDSELLLASGTTPSVHAHAIRVADYPPYIITLRMRITQRIANQVALVGLADNEAGSEDAQAYIVFDGVDDTKVKLRTSFDGTDVQETEVTLPNGGTTDDLRDYQIEIHASRVTLWVSNYRLADHQHHIPGPYALMDMRIAIHNTGTPASTTTLAVDSLYFGNFNKLNIELAPQSAPLEVQQSPASIPTHTNVAGAAADTQILAVNLNRKGMMVVNESTAILYLKLGTGASTTSYSVRMVPRAYYELPFNYLGAIHGYWASSTGFARVTELT